MLLEALATLRSLLPEHPLTARELRRHAVEGMQGDGDTGIREYEDTGRRGDGDTGRRGYGDTRIRRYEEKGRRGVSKCGAKWQPRIHRKG